MSLPEKIKTGDKRSVIYSRFNALVDFVRSLDIKGDNRTTFVSKTPAGIIIRGKDQSGKSAGGGTAAGYYDSFKVINDGTEIKVINGASPDSLFCGRTDIKGYILVQAFSLNDAKGKKIFIIGLSDGSTYSVVIYIEGNEPSATYKSDPIQLATVDSDGKVTQDWTDGDIKFSEDYFV